MNRVILMGRLTRDPEVRYTQGERSMAVARYTLAVDRRGRRNQDGNEQTADFINIVAFDRAGEFAEKYFRQGMRVLVSGRIQTGSYTNKEGQRVYTTDIIVDDQEFADSKKLCRRKRRQRRLRLSADLQTGSDQRNWRWLHEHPGWCGRRRTAV